MKKLKLNALQLNAKEILNREQLKNVMGGCGGGCGGVWICVAAVAPGYHLASPGTCTGNLVSCNATASAWCAANWSNGCMACACA